MTLAFPAIRPSQPSARELMRRALDPYLLIGMPHLTPHGLSETWLMKELGHRHWLMLARDLGMDNADFRTRVGDEAYAAISATSLQNARLDRVAANDVLTIHSSLRPISRAQFSSTHHLSVGARAVADVELISTFVHRQVAGDNLSLARVDCAGAVTRQPVASALAETAIAIRRQTTDTHLGLRLAISPNNPSFTFRPSPTEEFNGAGLFYFAEFQAIATRAIEAMFPEMEYKVARRDVFFSGNIHQSETIRVTLSDVGHCSSGVSCCLSRNDGQIIGKVVSLI